MRKTLRQLDWIVNDIDEAKKKLEAVIDDELDNEELQNEAEEAEGMILEARLKLLQASNILRQIYNECYED